MITIGQRYFPRDGSAAYTVFAARGSWVLLRRANILVAVTAADLTSEAWHLAA